MFAQQLNPAAAAGTALFYRPVCKWRSMAFKNITVQEFIFVQQLQGDADQLPAYAKF